MHHTSHQHSPRTTLQTQAHDTHVLNTSNTPTSTHEHTHTHEHHTRTPHTTHQHTPNTHVQIGYQGFVCCTLEHTPQNEKCNFQICSFRVQAYLHMCNNKMITSFGRVNTRDITREMAIKLVITVGTSDVDPQNRDLLRLIVCQRSDQEVWS